MRVVVGLWALLLTSGVVQAFPAGPDAVPPVEEIPVAVHDLLEPDALEVASDEVSPSGQMPLQEDALAGVDFVVKKVAMLTQSSGPSTGPGAQPVQAETWDPSAGEPERALQPPEEETPGQVPDTDASDGRPEPPDEVHVARSTPVRQEPSLPSPQPDSVPTQEAPPAPSTEGTIQVVPLERRSVHVPVLEIAAGILGGFAALVLFAPNRTASAVGGFLRRAAVPIMGLFAHIGRNEALKQPNRQEILEVVKADPGQRIAELAQRLEMGRTTISYHLDILERNGFVLARRVGRFRYFYPQGSEVDAHRHVFLLPDRQRRLAQCIADHPGSIQRQICEVVGIRPSRASECLSRMRQAGLVRSEPDGRTTKYYPTGHLQRLLFLAETSSA